MSAKSRNFTLISNSASLTLAVGDVAGPEAVALAHSDWLAHQQVAVVAVVLHLAVDVEVVAGDEAAGRHGRLPAADHCRRVHALVSSGRENTAGHRQGCLRVIQYWTTSSRGRHRQG